MALEYQIKVPDDARWSRVKIFCVHRQDEMIAELSTFDGVSPLFWTSEGSREEYIGWMPDEGTKRHLATSPITFATATAPPDDGDQPHMRITLACEKATCNYGPVIHERHLRRLHALVLALWANGGSEIKIPNLEYWLRPDKR